MNLSKNFRPSAARPPAISRESRASKHRTGARKFEIRSPIRRPTGADRDRTGNLRVANAALSQLSYGPGAKTRSRLVALPGASRPAAAK